MTLTMALWILNIISHQSRALEIKWDCIKFQNKTRYYWKKHLASLMTRAAHIFEISKCIASSFISLCCHIEMACSNLIRWLWSCVLLQRSLYNQMQYRNKSASLWWPKWWHNKRWFSNHTLHHWPWCNLNDTCFKIGGLNNNKQINYLLLHFILAWLKKWSRHNNYLLLHSNLVAIEKVTSIDNHYYFALTIEKIISAICNYHFTPNSNLVTIEKITFIVNNYHSTLSIILDTFEIDLSNR